MPDTKSGRERKGLDKEAQLEQHLTERELEALERDEEEPPRHESVDSELLAEPGEVDEVGD
jgi:hypothetical protein